MFHPLSYIYAKTPFCCIETVPNNALNCQYIVFDWLWANATPTLNTAFSLTNVHARWRIHWYLTQFQFTISQLVEFLEFSGTTAGFGWPEHSPSFVSVQLHLKSAYWQSRFQITLTKLWLNTIFYYQKVLIYQHTRFRFFHCFENLQHWLHLNNCIN